MGREVGVPAVIAFVILTALSIAVGFLVTRGFGGAVVAFDERLAERLASARTPGLTALTGAATILADSVNVAVLWVAAMVVAAWRTRRLRASVFLLTAIGGEKLNYLLTSIVVGRPRPRVPSLGHVYASNSFPSGHIGSAFVLYGGIAAVLLWHDANRRGRMRPMALRVLVGVAVLAAAVLVGFSRMYRGHHFLSDVLWGAVLGIAWLALAWRLVLAGRRDDRP